MKIIADLHIHSKYSRATSPQMNLENISQAAQIKGVRVISTGDFTHPAWFRELKDKLKPAEPGLFVLDKAKDTTRFILTTEISCIYSKNGKVRKVHILIFAPDLATVEKINNRLGQVGNLKADGRPILGLDAKDLLKTALEANPDCLVVCAHAWTPWFAVFGSKGGFNSLAECFEEQTKNIFAIETGISSDPAMNWQLSALDKVALISCSDAHSAPKIGREACVFDTALSYPAIVEAIKNKNPKKFLYTIEFFPEEGKYHYDGHRLCNMRLSPTETKKYRGLCPICGKPLVIGVASRVAELADRQEGFTPPEAIPYKRLIPLSQIIAEVLGAGEATKKAQEIYQRLILKLGPELAILIDCPLSDIEMAGGSALAMAIQKTRDGQVNIEPGYDGVYGKISILSANERKDISDRQGLLF